MIPYPWNIFLKLENGIENVTKMDPYLKLKSFSSTIVIRQMTQKSDSRNKKNFSFNMEIIWMRKMETPEGSSA